MLEKLKSLLTVLGAVVSAVLTLVLGAFLLDKKAAKDKERYLDERRWLKEKLAEQELARESQRIYENARLAREESRKKANDIANSGSFAEHIRRDLN